MKQTKASIALASAAILAVGTQLAGAVATMMISDGNVVSTFTIVDGLSGDLNPSAGAVTFVGAVGAWTINVDTGLTMPAVGSATLPYMDVHFLASSNLTAPGDLTISFSEIGFGPLNPGNGFQVAIGGTTEGTVTCTTLADINNVLFGGVPIVPVQTFGGPAFSCSTSGAAPDTSPFSLTKIVTIRHGSGQKTTSGDTQVTVPDGGTTLALLGCSMLGLSCLRRKLLKL